MSYENGEGVSCEGLCGLGALAPSSAKTVRYGTTTYGSLAVRIYRISRGGSLVRSSRDMITVTGPRGRVYTGTGATIPSQLRLPSGSYTVTVTGLGRPRHSKTIRVYPGRGTTARFYM